jgi:hypothetical protein
MYSPGVVLTCQSYQLTGTLANGDVLEVEFSGEQKTVGYCENVISHVKVYRTVDGKKKDVTKNYHITTESGMLTLYPPGYVIP